jgi:hypothetical protein
MQVKIFINDQLYKTVTVNDKKYQPNDFWPQIQADRDSGLLNKFNIAQGMKVSFQTVPNS